MADLDFELLFRRSRVPTLLVGFDDLVVAANDAYLTFTRRSFEDLVGQGTVRLNHPEDQAEIVAVALRLSAEEPHAVHERRHVRGDGTVARVRASLTLLPEARQLLIQLLDVAETGEVTHPDFGLDLQAGALRIAWDDGSMICDREGRVIRCLNRTTALLGRTEEAIIGRVLSDPALGFLGLDRVGLGPDRDPVLLGLASGENGEATIGVADGEAIRWLSLKVELVVGDIAPVIVFVRDVTDAVTVAEERRRLAAIAERTSDLVVAWDPDQRIRWTNQAAGAALPVGGAGQAATSIVELLAPAERDRWNDELLPALAAAGSWSGEIDLRRPDGLVLPAAVSLVADEGAPGAGSMVAHDLTDRIRLERELAHRASHDELTGVANRTLLFAVVEDELAHGRPIAVAFVDLDGFKAINDERGHAAGDRLLAAVAARLRLLTPPRGLVARLGGDEFVVVLANQLEAVGFADHATEALVGLDVGASIGVAGAEPGDTAMTLLARADAAMYERKRARAAR